MAVRANGLLFKYLVAVSAVVVGIGVKYLLGLVAPQTSTPYLLTALIVVAAGWYGGLGPGMVATVLSGLAVRWFFIEPRYTLDFSNPGEGLNLVVFVLEGGFISLLCEGRLWALRQNERARAELEQRVADRTAALSQANAALEQEAVERRRIEADILRQREFLRALLASLEEGIVAVDADGQVVLVNRAAREMYGLPDQPVPFERWEQFHKTFHGDGVTPMPHHERPLVRVMRDEVLVDVEKVVVGTDGRRRDLLSTGAAIIGPDGKRLGAVVAFRDVTDRRRREEERKRFMDQLERSNRELQDFASVASHDLQEPLRKIQAFGDRLRAKYAGSVGPEGLDYLNRMLNAAGRMSTLINDLLTFSRVTTRAQPFRPVDLGGVARDVASDLETRVEQTGGRIEIGALPVIDADPLQLRQLLQNLIGNALKFHKPGQGATVRVAAETDNGVCRLTVADDGIGFDEKYLDRIFNVFQRLHGRNEYEGTGIGLAVCRKIAERHHGTITARSVPGEGSTFVVTLPVKQQQFDAPSPPPPQHPAAATAAER